MDKVTLMQEGQDADVHVSWEDQQKINKFSQLNTILSEREEELADIQKQIEALEDARQELELVMDEEMFEDFEELDADEEMDKKESDGDSTEQKPKISGQIPYKIGDAFFMFTSESAQDRLKTKTGQYEKELKDKNLEIEKINSEMSELKKLLYARFGTAIQLERE